MDYALDADLTAPADTADDPLVESASAEFLGRWNHLISTTNWEKGRIIFEWRQALEAAAAPPQSSTDEAWSRRAGGLTPQHAGRLRRVYQRFGAVRQQYDGLYWSHFQVALDWSDAEMWLEGAVQNHWSVSQMQHERGQTLDNLPDDANAELLTATAGDLDEDATAAHDQPPAAVSSTLGEVRDVDDASERSPAGAAATDDDDASDGDEEDSFAAADESAAPVRPFANLPELPADMQEAFESFKLAIVRHRHAGWREVTCGQVLEVLDALRAFAQAPAEA